MNTLITGITGMVGSHLLDLLIKKTNWNIIGTYRWRSSLENLESHIKSIEKRERIFLEYADLNDLSSLNRIISKYKPKYIFHLAAQSFPQTSFTIPYETLQTNILGTLNLMESVRLNNYKPIVHICSSSEVFGRVPKELVPIDENCTYHPASPYAISKVGTDLLGRFYAEAYDIHTLTTRMFTHTGPRRGDIFAESTFAKQIALIEANKIDPVIKVGNLDSTRTYADVRDAVNAYYMLVTNKKIPKGEYFNIGGTYTCKVGDMLDALLNLSKVRNIKIKVDKSRLRKIDADLQIPNCQKFIQYTGWKPKYKFDDTMRDLLNYWRKKIKRNNHYTSS